LHAANSPVLVGVCQHPDLTAREIPAIAHAVADLLGELLKHLPHTGVGLILEAGGEASATTAHAALALGVSVELLTAASGSESAAWAAFKGDPRVRRIEAAARHAADDAGARDAVADILVRRSSLLVALWDGGGSAARGDPADIVSRFLGVRAEKGETARILEIAAGAEEADATAEVVFWVPAYRGPAYRGPADRGGDIPAAGARQPCFLVASGDHVLDAHHAMPVSFVRRLADLDEFNHEYRRFTADGSLVPAGSLMLQLPAGIAADDAPVLAEIDAQYVKADSLATHMQWRSDRLFNLFGITAFIMGLAYLIYDQILESRILLIAYMLVLFAGFLAYYFLQQKRWFGKHLAYRALAETLRVRFYLALAGLDLGMHTADLIALTGIHRFRGFSWIGLVLDAVEPTTATAHPAGETYLRRGRFIEEAWIESQYRYFKRKVAQMEKDSRRVSRLKGLMFTAALVDIGAMFIFGGTLHHVDTTTGLPVKNVLTFCCGFLAVLLGVWELRQTKMATRELLWQYRNQLSQFQRARTLLRRTASRIARDGVLLELGDSSLMETYLWAIHRYHREHAPPTGH
jgi:hypothetical protein